MSPIVSNALWTLASRTRAAWSWSSLPRAGQRASSAWTRSPDETTSAPAARTSSIVPASTRETGGTFASAEYSIATRFPATISFKPASSSERRA